MKENLQAIFEKLMKIIGHLKTELKIIEHV